MRKLFDVASLVKTAQQLRCEVRTREESADCRAVGSTGAGRAVGDRDIEMHELPIAEHHHRHCFAHVGQAHEINQMRVVIDRDAVELEDHVVRLQFRGRSWGIRRDRRDMRSFGPRQTETHGHLIGKIRIERHS